MGNQKSFSRKNSIVLAIAVAVITIGTATGSALTMLIMSAIALFLMSILYRHQFSARLLAPAVTAAITAIVIGAIMATR